MALTSRAKRLLPAAAALFCLLAVLVVWLPTVWINRPEARDAIQRYLGTAIGGTIAFGRINLSIFPRICASVEHPRLDLPDQVTARAAEIDLCLQLLPLLRGRVLADSVHIRFPEIDLTASEMPIPATHPHSADILHLLAEAAGRLKHFPESAIEMSDGRMTLFGPEGSRLEFRSVNLRWFRNGPDVEWTLESESDSFAALSSAGRLDTGSLKGTATLKAADVQAHRVYAWLRPQDPFLVREARLDLDIAVRLDGPEHVSAVIQAKAPAITLIRQHRETRLSVSRLMADVALSPKRLAVDVHECVTAAPQAAIELSLVVDEQVQPHIDVNLGGRGDAGEARRAALALLQESSDVSRVFEVLRDGEIPAININLRGNTWNELVALSNLQIEGRLENGRVYLPWIDLDLDAVCGEVRISEGVLEGRELKAHYKGTQGENGSLRVGLSSADPVLQLDIFAHAALSPLPPLLARLVSDPVFRKQAALVEEFAGTAQGTLRLNGTHTDVDVNVQAFDIDVKARHQLIGYPLRFQGGEFAYEGNSIHLRGVDVTLGSSKLFKHDLTLGLDGDLPFASSSPKAVINQSEMLDLFRDRPPFNHLSRLDGVFTFNNWQLNGQAFAPATWRLMSTGTLQDLSVESELLPGLLSLPAGSFDWQGQTVRYQAAKGSIGRSEIKGLAVEADWTGPARVQLRALELDASIDEISQVLQSFPETATYAAALHPVSGTARMRDVKFQTRLLPEGPVLDQFAAGLQNSVVTSAPIGLPLALTAGDLDWQGSTLKLWIAKASLGQSEIQNLSIVADGSTGGGLELRTDSAVIACGEIFARLLPLAGLEGLREDVRDIQGTLTASRISIQGPLRDPRNWRIQAASEFKDILVATTFLDDPIELPAGRLTFAAAEEPKAAAVLLQLDSIRMRIGTDSAVLSGEVERTDSGTTLQIGIRAETLEWSRIEKLSERFARHRRPDSRPVHGRLNLRLERLVIDRVHLYPLHADVQLAANGTRIEIERAGFCGMTVIGRIDFDGSMVDAYLVPVVDVMPLDGVISCPDICRRRWHHPAIASLRQAFRPPQPGRNLSRKAPRFQQPRTRLQAHERVHRGEGWQVPFQRLVDQWPHALDRLTGRDRHRQPADRLHHHGLALQDHRPDHQRDPGSSLDTRRPARCHSNAGRRQPGRPSSDSVVSFRRGNQHRRNDRTHPAAAHPGHPAAGSGHAGDVERNDQPLTAHGCHGCLTLCRSAPHLRASAALIRALAIPLLMRRTRRSTMAYTCKTCGAVANEPGHLCNPCGDKTKCSFCGAPSTDAKHVCKDKLSAMKYVCGGCGRVAMEAGHLCNPNPIR